MNMCLESFRQHYHNLAFDLLSVCTLIPVLLVTANTFPLELERRNILKEAQFISVIGFEDNTLIVRDLRKSGQLIEVHIKNKKLKCIADDDFDCIHVGFALALPEVRMPLKSMH
jgi:hypothetical protein